jgi:23S rRNA G2445 N2-methylase RlmL
MPRFLATTSKGLSELLAREVAGHGGQQLEVRPSGVLFDANWSQVYSLILLSRLSSRVLLPLMVFRARDAQELYNGVRRHNFLQYISADQRLSVSATVAGDLFRDLRFVALKVKDAVVDQFRDKLGRRPDVDRDDPDLHLMVHVEGDQVHVSIDLVGRPLYHRGWRVAERGQASLKENLAFGALQLAGWTDDMPLVDPFAGHGALVIEAARAREKWPGRRHEMGYLFERLLPFDAGRYEQALIDAHTRGESESSRMADGRAQANRKLRIWASDAAPEAVGRLRDNARRAQVLDRIEIECRPVADLAQSAAARFGPGLIVTDPPYGVRSQPESLDGVYREFGRSLKTGFQGWRLALLSGDPQLPRFMGLKADRRIPLWNGPIECRLLLYEIRARSSERLESGEEDRG